MNRWYQQLFKKVESNPDLGRLKISEETFSENYQGDFAVGDAIPDLEVLATINSKNRAQARLVKIARDSKIGIDCDSGIESFSVNSLIE